jgi:hypothetical protein
LDSFLGPSFCEVSSVETGIHLIFAGKCFASQSPAVLFSSTL